MTPADAPEPTESRQGDGVELPVVKARSAERGGVIWMLVASLGAAVVILAGFWLVNFAHFSQVATHQS